MKWLIPLFVLLATNVYAANESVYLDFTYDHQNIAEYQIQSVGVKVNDSLYCETNRLTTDPATGAFNYVCGDRDFPAGQYDFQLVVICADGVMVESQVVSADIPPEVEPLPPRKKPVIIRGRVERDGKVIVEIQT